MVIASYAEDEIQHKYYLTPFPVKAATDVPGDPGTVPYDHTHGMSASCHALSCVHSVPLLEKTAVWVASLQQCSCMSDTQKVLSPQHVHDTASALAVVTWFSSVQP